MSKLFKCNVDWYNGDSNPSSGIDNIIVAANNYISAVERLVDYYRDELTSFSIYELDNPCLIEDLINK